MDDTLSSHESHINLKTVPFTTRFMWLCGAQKISQLSWSSEVLATVHCPCVQMLCDWFNPRVSITQTSRPKPGESTQQNNSCFSVFDSRFTYVDFLPRFHQKNTQNTTQKQQTTTHQQQEKKIMSTERKIWFAAAKKGVLEEIKKAIQDASFAKEKNFAIVDELGMCCVVCCVVLSEWWWIYRPSKHHWSELLINKQFCRRTWAAKANYDKNAEWKKYQLIPESAKANLSKMWYFSVHNQTTNKHQTSNITSHHKK